jgi:hypothetical protein
MAVNALSLPALIVGVAFLLLALRLLLRHGLLAHFFRLILAVVLFSAGTYLLLAGFDLVGYKKLLDEEPVAALRFDRLGEQRYRVSLIDAEDANQQFVLRGDEWQLDVRLIRWHPGVARLGLKPLYRLDRLSGRYRAVAEETRLPRTVHGLAGQEGLVDTWQMLDRIPGLDKLLDTRQGSAAYLPMVDGGHFIVTINSAGLVARPANEEARQAVSSW